MNILGIGIDIIEISRIIKASNRNNRFLERLFTDNEIAYFKLKNLRPETIAGNFCAKEAFSKALGTGIRGFDFKDIEILRDNQGRPYMSINENLYKKYNIDKVFISISHCKEYACANVTITKLTNLG